MASSKGKDNKKVQGLANKLAGVASVAKSMGINTAKSDAMVAQTKKQGSKAYKGSSYDRGQQDTITSDAMKPAPVTPIAKAPPIDGMFGATASANAYLAGQGGGTFDVKTGQIVPAPTPTEPNQTASDAFKQIFDASNAAIGNLKMPSATDNFKEMQKMLRPKENLKNSLAGQLNVIQERSNAQQLALEGQGRGQTTSFLGGEQARISREAAIASMPIQAQLAIAQDDLDSARLYASQYFQAKMQDETNAYNLKKENLQNLTGFLNAQETRRQAATEKELDRAYAEKQATAKTAESIALQAIEYGQSGLATRIMGLNPKSITYADDVRKAMGELRKPVAAVKRDTQFDSNGNLVDMQTGAIISKGAATDKPVTIDGKPQTQAQFKVQGYADRLAQAEQVLKDSDKFGSVFALGGILPNWAKSEDRQQYEQAKRNFINAVLRTESGAVISDEEFANAEKQYFPTPGDETGTLANKKANRQTVIDNFYREANVPNPTAPAFNASLFDATDYAEIDSVFGVTFNPSSYY